MATAVEPWVRDLAAKLWAMRPEPSNVDALEQFIWDNIPFESDQVYLKLPADKWHRQILLRVEELLGRPETQINMERAMRPVQDPTQSMMIYEPSDAMRIKITAKCEDGAYFLPENTERKCYYFKVTADMAARPEFEVGRSIVYSDKGRMKMLHILAHETVPEQPFQIIVTAEEESA